MKLNSWVRPYDFSLYYLSDIHRTEEDVQVPKLGVFLWGDLIQPTKLVGIDGFMVSQVEWFILGGKGFPWTSFGMSAEFPNLFPCKFHNHSLLLTLLALLLLSLLSKQHPFYLLEFGL